MIPLIIECNDENEITKFLREKYYLHNLASEIKPENDSIGLPAIKYLTDRAKFSGGEKSQTVYLIWQGHLITPAGQNALLKTLEESRPSQQFIITTHNHYLLLETFISRCQIINLANRHHTGIDKNFLLKFTKDISSSATCLQTTDEIIATDPHDYLNQIIDNLRTANQQMPTLKRAQALSLATTCLSDLNRNLNPKLALDHFLIEAGKLVSNTLK